jgi:hypothetical protein
MFQRMLLARLSITLPVLLASVGCEGRSSHLADEPSTMMMPHEPRQPDPPARSLSSCTIEAKWAVEDETRMYSGQLIRESPNGALLMREDRFRATYLRARDGGLRWMTEEHNLDVRWERRLDVDLSGQLSVVDVHSPEKILTVAAPDSPVMREPRAWTVARFDKDGTRILALDCF